MRKEVNKIEIQLDTKEGILYVWVNDNEYMFTHHYNWHDIDDLCVTMQKIYNISTDKVYEIWDFVKTNREAAIKGVEL